MTTDYKVKLAKVVKKEIRDIFDYIKKDLQEPETAKGIMREIDNTIIGFKSMPGRWSLNPDEVLARRGYHRALAKNYVILFLIDEQNKIVSVAHVFHGTQNYARYV
jgi:plasmid stabilization system protein ParE